MSPRPLAFDPIAKLGEQWREAGWENAATAMALYASVMRAQQLMLKRGEDIVKPHGLSWARFEALMVLLLNEGTLALGKLGEQLQVYPGAVTNAIDRLEAQGLVRRKPDPSDGRTTLAVLTARGRRIATQIADELDRRTAAELALPPADVHRLFMLLQQLRENAGDFEATGR